MLKLGADTIILGLIVLQGVAPPIAVAAVLAAVLVTLVVAERTLFPPSETVS